MPVDADTGATLEPQALLQHAPQGRFSGIVAFVAGGTRCSGVYAASLSTLRDNIQNVLLDHHVVVSFTRLG